MGQPVQRLLHHSGNARTAGRCTVVFGEPNWHCMMQVDAQDRCTRAGSRWPVPGSCGACTTTANAHGNSAAARADGKACGSDVLACTIEEGLRRPHRDLRDKVDPAAGGFADNGIDDIKERGLFSNDFSPLDGGSGDGGAHVAGNIAAQGSNATGVHDLCWKPKLNSARFLGPSGGTTTDAVPTLDTTRDLKCLSGLNLMATHDSCGGGLSLGPKHVIDRTGASDIRFIIAPETAAGTWGSPTSARPVTTATTPSGAHITSTGAPARNPNDGPARIYLGAQIKAAIVARAVQPAWAD